MQRAYADMALARMVMIAAGYEDCDYIDTRQANPAFKLLSSASPTLAT